MAHYPRYERDHARYWHLPGLASSDPAAWSDLRALGRGDRPGSRAARPYHGAELCDRTVHTAGGHDVVRLLLDRGRHDGQHSEGPRSVPDRVPSGPARDLVHPCAHAALLTWRTPFE